MKKLGDRTYEGVISAVGWLNGERYYWIIDKRGAVSMMPASTIEQRDVATLPQAPETP